ncbi:mas-related G-protein coupled receptor member H-like [Dromiciops gliroides]|uniref:mas-related G-protein coupled receptor member H-like n=1 Tax=Dromiciops gliroides TaxID=33562 RepID=UPI001CC7D0D6|nr:mas-related G-protein coupled receptor member H-like [Dromiciops gliroides]
MVMSSTSKPFMQSTTDALSHMNDSFSNSPSARIISTYLSLLITLLGTAGNGLVIWFLLFHFKKNPFTVYILNLSIADLTFLLCTSTVNIGTLICYNFNIQPFGLRLFLTIFYVLILFGYNTGFYLLTAISVERCLSVLYPIWYKCQRLKHQSAIVCTLLWVLSVLVSGLECFVCIWAAEPRFPFRPCMVVEIFLLVLNFLVFAPLMVISNFTLFIKVFCNLKHRRPAKLYIIIITTVILFLVFAMPSRVFVMIYNFENENYESLALLYPYLSLLSFINSTVNPIVYLVVGRLRGQRTRKSLKDTLQKVFEDKPQPRVRMMSSVMLSNAFDEDEHGIKAKYHTDATVLVISLILPSPTGGDTPTGDIMEPVSARVTSSSTIQQHGSKGRQDDSWNNPALGLEEGDS